MLEWDRRAGKVMLVGTRDAGIKAWHVDTARSMHTIMPEDSAHSVTAIACSPMEPLFVVACARGEANLAEDGCGDITLVISVSERAVDMRGINRHSLDTSHIIQVLETLPDVPVHAWCRLARSPPFVPHSCIVQPIGLHMP